MDSQFRLTMIYVYYSILQFYGEHGPKCHSRPMLSGCNSRPAQRAFQTYLSADGVTGNEESGMS
jgi:hypothetical protein